MRRVYLYDTTLRDGSQGEGISFSVHDKLKITARLDRLGVDYIEGGWPGSNPKDLEYFQQVRELKLSHAKVTAFGSTRRAGVKPEEDANLSAIIAAGVQAVAIFGKSWDLHVTEALNVPLQENLAMIYDSVSFLKSKGIEVIYDAEHFFDGYKANPEYALETILTAERAGADWIALCDTNGGSLPHEISGIVTKVLSLVNVPIGIHCHNDGDLAVANTLAAVQAGVTQVQGTINGLGERCGNANLCSVIPNLQLKMGYNCLDAEHLRHLTEVSHYVSEIANVTKANNQPFVGQSAFAHKGGIHVSAVLKNPKTYEHMNPELIGNKRRVLVSELAGASNLQYKAQELGMKLLNNKEQNRKIIQEIKRLEYEGYQFEGAEASLELFLKRATGEYQSSFSLESIKVLVEKRGGQEMLTEAMIKLRVGERVVHTAAEGNGPVNALDNALRKALEECYPFLKEMHLSDYKVRVLDEKDATKAKVRVLIESRDTSGSWSTMGVSHNIIEASWQALVDSMDYAMMRQMANEADEEVVLKASQG
ncbi:citramalate synthase [Zhaonella formicivorans]|uniref:citramalate synthase n=1 Tax=Zhaonella formicivorans TaxID=2528593 RepID=UPI0010E30CEE|nr:citramalate synthase [Zhaonella formicivorans]